MAVPDGGHSVFLCSKGVADESESQSVGQLFESQKNPILMACPNCPGSSGLSLVSSIASTVVRTFMLCTANLKRSSTLRQEI